MRIDITPITKVMSDTLMTSASTWDKTDCYYRVETLAGFPVSVYWKPDELKSFCKNDTVSEVLTSWETNYYKEVGQWQMAAETGLHPRNGKWERVETGKTVYNYIGGECYPQKELAKTGVWLADSITQRSAKQILEEKKKRAGKLVLVKYVKD